MADATTESSGPASSVNHLANTLACPAGIAATVGALEGHDVLRKYRSCLTSTSQIHQRSDTNAREITWLVGASATKEAVFRMNERAMRVACPFNTGDILTKELSAVAQRNANFTTSYAKMEFCGIVERLAKGVSTFVSFGTLSCDDLLGGHALRVTSVDYLQSPIAAGTNDVFLPRIVDTPMHPNVLCAIAHAVSGEAGHLVTDYVGVDSDTGRVILGLCEGVELATACWDAIHLIGANMLAHNAGAHFMYALVRGIHSGVTVNGHTDEAGWFRKVLRADAFASPYGALSPGYTRVPSLPVAFSRSLDVLTGIVDSTALSSAALVAISDPCIKVYDKWFPTNVSHPAAMPVEQTMGRVKSRHEIMAEIAHEDACARANADGQAMPVYNAPEMHVAWPADAMYHEVLSYMQPFAVSYTTNLARLIGTPATAEDAAGPTEHLMAVAQRRVVNRDRHMEVPSMAPFFWVEPTGLVPAKVYDDCTAVRAGYGALCSVSTDYEYNAFPGAELHSFYGENTVLRFDHRSIRTVPGFLHLTQHRQDGLANIHVQMGDPNAMLNTGSFEIPETLMMQRSGMQTYAWGRGDSTVPVPAEFMYVADGDLLFNISHGVFDADGTFDYGHIQMRDELLTSKVRFSISLPSYIGTAPRRHREWRIRKARNAAARALTQAARNVRSNTSRLSAGAMQITFQSYIASTAAEDRMSVPHDQFNIPLQNVRHVDNSIAGKTPITINAMPTGGRQTSRYKLGQHTAPRPVEARVRVGRVLAPQAQDAVVAQPGVGEPPAPHMGEPDPQPVGPPPAPPDAADAAPGVQQ